MSDKLAGVAHLVGVFLTAGDCANLGEVHETCGDRALIGSRFTLIQNQLNTLLGVLKESGGFDAVAEISKLIKTSLFTRPSTAMLGLSQSGINIAISFHISGMSSAQRAQAIGLLFLQGRSDIADTYFLPMDVEMAKLKAADEHLKTSVEGTPYQESLLEAENPSFIKRMMSYGMSFELYDSTKMQTLVERAINAGDIDLAFEFMFQIRSPGAQERLIDYIASLGDLSYLTSLKDQLMSEGRIAQIDREIELLMEAYMNSVE